MSAKFAHLHVHSHYSLLKALPKIPQLVARAKEEGLESLALTDLGNLYGAIEFYKECQSAGIKPIIGVDVHIGDGKRKLLYAENNTGYHNLLKIVTASNIEFPDNPTVTAATLKAYSEGIIALDPNDDSVALREIYYLDRDDRRAWETMRAIENKDANEGGDINDEDLEYFFPSSKQMLAMYEDKPKALARTLEIAERCNIELTIGKFIFPEF